MLPRSVFDKLSGLPPGSLVRVVVQGPDVANPATRVEVDPKSFASSVEYRTALLERSRAWSQASRAIVERKARELGLEATPAANLSTVTVEGPSESVLSLLEQVDVRTVVLERPLTLGPLPKPAY